MTIFGSKKIPPPPRLWLEQDLFPGSGPFTIGHTQVQVGSTHNDALQAWQKPPLGFVKVNIDAGFDTNAAKVGFGWCGRGSSGEFMLAHVSSFGGVLSPAEGKALGLLRAMQWVITLHIDRVLFETDCKVVVD